MAEKVWIGAPGSGGDDVGVATNYLGGVLPVAGDDLVADERAVRRMGSNLGALGSLSLRRFMLSAGYRLGIGGEGEALALTLSASGAYAAIGVEAGNLYLALTTPLLHVQRTGLASLSLVGGVADLLTMHGGGVRVLSGAEVVAAEQYGGAARAEAGPAASSWAVYAGASLGLARDVAALAAAGSGTVVEATDSMDIDAAEVGSGAVLAHRARGDVDALTILPGGQFTRAGATGAARIGVSSLEIWPATLRRFDEPGVATSYNGAGGTAVAVFRGGLETSSSLNNAPMPGGVGGLGV